MKYLYIVIFITAFSVFSCTTGIKQTKLSLAENNKYDNSNISIKNKKIEKKANARQKTKNTAALLLAQVKEAYNSGNFSKCLNAARELRIKYPFSDEIYPALYLSGLAEIKLDEPYRARYFFKRVIYLIKKNNSASSQMKDLKYKTEVMLGDILYKEHLYNESLKYYTEAAKAKKRKEVSAVFLRIAEIYYYEKKNIHNARFYFLKINPDKIGKAKNSAYIKLKNRLEWENLLPEDLGINDGNISAVATDGDDLWIGTWNGGIARYNMSMGKTAVFKKGAESLVPRTVRTVEITKRRVWVGSFSGLSYYSKASSKWYAIKIFSSPEPVKVETIKSVNDRLYIGTLGEGLWLGTELNVQNFHRLDFPSQFINCISYYNNYLLIGTMDMGIFIINISTGKITNFQDLFPGFTPLNITTIITGWNTDLWIGTYGKGLFHWIKNSGRMEIYTKENGRIRDNWILSSVKTEKGLYFGTFGGGIIHVDKKENIIKNIGLKDGLSSLDISALAYARPLLILGTLGMGITIFYEDIKE
ncbi:MAG: hypothetical protein J7K04_12180 [Spirochaetales bacterium]|nr:hypothetical protein [Spirochaetales bacterium]